MPMPALAEKVSSNGKPISTAGPRSGRSPLVGRRRQMPWIVAGVVLVVDCGLAFAVASARMSTGSEVLAIAQPVPAGQTLTAPDVRVVRVSVVPGLTPVLAGAEGTVLGRPAAVALVPGTLLTSADVGAPPTGAAGYAAVALALKAGAFPPSLSPGDTVAVVPVAASGSGGGGPLTGNLATVRAVVLEVSQAPSGSSADSVVTLQVNPSDAPEVAQLAAAGQAALVQMPAASGAGGSGQ
jgi:hypothetical protein